MKKKTYQAPLVELLEARVEKGFQGSLFNDGDNPQSLQNYQNGGDQSSLFN